MGAELVTGFFLVFSVIIFFEFFDRSNFALIALTARQPPRPSWMGAAAAFVVVSAIAVTIGSGLTSALGPSHVALLRIGGGVFLVAYALYVLWEPEAEESGTARMARTPFMTAFLLIFFLELGDTTMIFEVIFVGTIGNPYLVFAAGSLGLVLVAACGCFIGSRLGARVDPDRLKWVIVSVLLLVGVLTILYGVDPTVFPVIGTVVAGF